MISIATSHRPATDLGYLLHKNPARIHELSLNIGEGWVSYSQATEEICRAHLLLEVDPVKLVRENEAAAAYVDDRAFLAGTFAAVALGRAFGTALSGRCKDKPELAETAIPLEIEAAAVRLRSEGIAERFFAPLGWEVDCQPFPSGRAGRLTIRGEMRLAEALRHVQVLLPALEGRRHFRVDRSEMETILRRAESWLPTHPAREEILRGALQSRRPLVLEALARLAEAEGLPEAESEAEAEEAEPRGPSLHAQRHEAVVREVIQARPGSFLDLGCGGGEVINALVRSSSIPRLTGLEASWRQVESLKRRRLQLTSTAQARVEFLHGSLGYRDERLKGHDCAALVEVIEHLDERRVRDMARVLFGWLRPRIVIITTPNAEANPLLGDFEGMRHSDHRFEWTRAEMRAWCEGIRDAFGYEFRLEGIGPDHPELGAPSQMAVFTA